VPSNSIVVFEDVDTMSTSLHARHTPSSHIQIQNSSDQQQKDERKFNLGSFLSILDGHTLEDGIVFLMTTNHKDRLDSAIIRPGKIIIIIKGNVLLYLIIIIGRMDVHLELGYSTHYQMRRIYEMVMDDSSKLDDVYPSFENEIPEFVVPPSEIMQIMVLYRQDTALIPSNLKQIAGKYSKNTNEIMPLE
jgi:hypothetical protein